MNKIDYQALRAKAEKATCGEWSLEYGEERFDAGDALIHREVVGYLPICRIEGAHPESGFDEDFQMEQQANAEFIAAFNPKVALALLDERERNQQYIKSRDQENEDIALTVGRLRVELEAAKKRIAELEAEPVSQTYNLPELIEGMEVSIDVSTCDADLGNRYFGTVTEALELDTAKNGYILLVQDAEPNFDVNGNSPVTPDGWVIVPKKLTAENGAKGVLSGEFSETTFISCPECFGDDDCETCDGSGRIEIKVPVSWTTIKTIWAKGCEYFSIVAPQQDG
ncbi:ead/Ea22-like family protein [Escherichia coli]|uniref:ead/Ea22-like family protein n=4 Tax=Escherichia coli TaxID=562 RepID=UPI000DDDFFE8|nr:ead/Ea22-like family protein [Escherichia coli]MCH7155083.1 ead/Ea22-like family protein [Escherichia coli]MCH7169314.1 ead/Ea22-like family protein [Escherichia coli]MCH7188732.1 ead/Ea22-like family protein [Escherichia coli]MCH7203282.1 ead/Ea22-like family protein [Escherichia coli]MCH7213179.1 ead/Ea22-like family protein [Escherichia coli]